MMRILNKISAIVVLLSAVFCLGSCGGGGGTSTFVLTGFFTTTNVVGATMAHIHDGEVGKTGLPVVGLVQTAPGTWTVPANFVLTDAQVLRLKAGANYVNVHTTLNPDGEIRGQLVVSSTNPNMFTATLTLADEVPTPVTPAGASPTGSGSVTLTFPAGAAY